MKTKIALPAMLLPACFCGAIWTQTSGMAFAQNAQTSGAAKLNNSQNYQTQEFDVTVGAGASGDRKITTRVISPPAEKLAKKPLLLLSFAMDRNTSLGVEPYNLTAKYFLEHGHRVASFDLPNHGSRVNQYGEAITGMRNAFVAAQDPFSRFVEEGKAVTDRCIANGLAEPGRIAVCGTSRAGYLALRLLAADKRIAAAAVYAPVTDWRALTEFAADQKRADVAALNLSNFADALAGKPLYMVMGNHDARVSTESCCRFYLDLAAANARHNFDNAHLNFQVQDTPGHSSQVSWSVAGAEFLLKPLQ